MTAAVQIRTTFARQKAAPGPGFAPVPSIVRLRPNACPDGSGFTVNVFLFKCFVSVLIVGLCCLTLWLKAFLAPSMPEARFDTEKMVQVQAQPTDTYWSIAHRYGGPGDVGALVDEMVERNDSAHIQPGMTVLMPKVVEVSKAE